MFSSGLIQDAVLIVRWEESVSLADVSDLRATIKEVALAVGPAKLVYVAVIPDGVPTPSSEVRTALEEGLVEARQLCASAQLIIEGPGLRKAVMRAILTALLFGGTAGGTRCPVGVHEEMHSALRCAHQHAPFFRVNEALSEARALGLCKDDRFP
jgi:hypothetical protein